MKKVGTICLILLFTCFRAQDISTVFTNETLVYYGIDFSKAFLIGDFGTGDGTLMRDKMFSEWNDIVIRESGKFNIAKAFRKASIYYEMGPVTEENQHRDPSNIRQNNELAGLTTEQIQQMVKNYKPAEKKAGTALVFIIEYFNKHTETAVVHVTLFDIVSKQILITEKMMGSPHGIGLRNFWANAIYSIIKLIEETKYHQWKRTYHKE